MTPNLHLLMCQLREQWLRVGQTVDWYEYWVERIIKKFKQLVVNRATKEPEKVLTNALALEYKLRMYHAYVMTMPASVDKRASRLDVDHNLYSPATMLGTAQTVASADVLYTCIAAALNSHLEELFVSGTDVVGWASHEQDTVKIERYQRMLWCGRKIASRDYTRMQQKDDSHVAVHDGHADLESPAAWLGQVTGLFCVSIPAAATAIEFFAMTVQLFSRPKAKVSRDLGIVYEASTYSSTEGDDCRVFILSKKCCINKLVYVKEQGVMYMCEYGQGFTDPPDDLA